MIFSYEKTFSHMDFKSGWRRAHIYTNKLNTIISSDFIDANKTALLVIDVINSCCSEKCEIRKWNITFKRIRKMVPRLENFIRHYKKLGGQVIYTNCVPWDKKHLAKNIIELYKDPKARYYSKDKTGFSEEFFHIKPEKNDHVVTKNSYDAFTNPQLDKILKKMKVKHIIITGVFADGCVHATVQGGFSKGYNFIIVKDMIETTDVKIRQELQKKLKLFTWPVMFGNTIDSKDLIKKLK